MGSISKNEIYIPTLTVVGTPMQFIRDGLWINITDRAFSVRTVSPLFVRPERLSEGSAGGGSHIAQQLAHIGVGNLFLINPDTIDKEGTNLNRLIGATEKDVEEETLKLEIAKRLISSVDSKIQAQTFATTWQENLQLLRDADVVFGATTGCCKGEISP
ncbi:MAG: ThiF family adenylyltransferase [Acidobacteriota bacterium]